MPINHTIHERPLGTQFRTEIGHWKIKTVVGKAGGQCLLTMIDRKTRYLLAKKATHKRVLPVNQTINSLIYCFATKATQNTNTRLRL